MLKKGMPGLPKETGQVVAEATVVVKPFRTYLFLRYESMGV